MSGRSAGITLPAASGGRPLTRGAAMPMPSAPVEEEPLHSPGIANIGRSVSIRGDVQGDEDLYIEGKVDGRISLASHHLIIGPNGQIRGEVGARQVTVVGSVEGNITATERVEVCDSGVVDGDITSPRLLIQEGASFNGSITMVGAPEGGAKKRPGNGKLKLDRMESDPTEEEDDVEPMDIEALMDDIPAGGKRPPASAPKAARPGTAVKPSPLGASLDAKKKQ